MAVTTIQTYALDGTTKQYAVTFEYLARSFVQVRLLSNSGNIDDLKLGTDYRFISATQIELTVVPDNTTYQFLEVKRVTSATSRVVNFQDGSILRATDLNAAEMQGLHVAEEARDAASLSISINSDSNMDAQQRRIVNVKDGIDPQDAATMSQLDVTSASAGQSARDAASSAAQAQTTQTLAAGNQTAAKASEDAAAESAAHALVSETNAKASENAAAASATRSQTSNSQSAASAAAALISERNAKASENAAAGSQVAAAGSVVSATTEANRSRTEADRAKAEADKIAGQNELTNAINAVGAAPDYTVDFKSMLTVNGTPITASLQGQGFQVNTSDVAGDGTDPADNLNANSWAGKNFMAYRGKVNSAGTSRANNTPLDMEYEQALVSDIYGTWTPTSGTQGRTRIQMMVDKNALWLRGYHHQDTTWTEWKSVPSQDFTNADKMDLNAVTATGNYTYVTATNAPVIDGDDASPVYFLSVHSTSVGAKVYVYQEIFCPAIDVTFQRTGVDGVFNEWVNTTALTDVATAAGGVDLDTIDNGIWGVPADTAVNIPTSATKTGQGLLVASSTSVGQTSQTYTDTALNKRYVRTRDGKAATWSAWEQIFTIGGAGGSGADAILDLIKTSGKPLTLGSPGVGDYDAVTVKQLRDGGGSSGGGSSSIMAGFLGEVSWFNGKRAHLPAGYEPADGQLLSRATNADLWAAVEMANGLTSVTDAVWLANVVQRGRYSTGDGSTNFRMPDLNGTQSGSIYGTFLRGSPVSAETAVGSVTRDAAPEISGSFSSDLNGRAWMPFPAATAHNAFTTTDSKPNSFRPTAGFDSATENATVVFNASKSSSSYGRDGAVEVRPNNAQGFWIIRASGAFIAAKTEFSVVAGDTTAPAAGVVSSGGVVKSLYNVGQTQNVASAMAVKRVSGGDGRLDFTVTQAAVGAVPSKSATMGFGTDGSLTVPDIVKANRLSTTGNVTFGGLTTINAPLNVGGTTTLNGDTNARALTSANLTTGGVRVTANGLSPSNGQGGYMVWNENGDGATSFVNNKGGGSGGFKWRNVNAANNQQDAGMTLFADGSLRVTHDIAPAQNITLKGGGHGFEWISGIASNTDGPYLTFTLDGGQKGVHYFDSDRKFKEDIEPVEVGKALADLDKIQPVSYHWITNEDPARAPYGMIAQDLEEVCSSLVDTNTNKDGSTTKAINPLAMLGFLLATVKDLKAEVDALKAKQ